MLVLVGKYRFTGALERKILKTAIHCSFLLHHLLGFYKNKSLSLKDLYSLILD